MLSYDLTNIGKQARARRKTQGWTQADVARQIQAHRNEISRIENGKYSGNLATFIRYLNALGMSLTTTVSRHPTLEELDGIFNEDGD